MKINGWKMIFPFEMIPFQVTCSFFRGNFEFEGFQKEEGFKLGPGIKS